GIAGRRRRNSDALRAARLAGAGVRPPPAVQLPAHRARRCDELGLRLGAGGEPVALLLRGDGRKEDGRTRRASLGCGSHRICLWLVRSAQAAGALPSPARQIGRRLGRRFRWRWYGKRIRRRAGWRSERGGNGMNAGRILSPVIAATAARGAVSLLFETRACTRGA